MSGYYFCLAMKKSTGKMKAYSIPLANFPPSESSDMEIYLEKNRGRIVDNLMTHDKNDLIEQMAKAGVEVPKGDIHKIDLVNLLTDFLLKEALDDVEEDNMKQFSVKYFLQEIRNGESDTVEQFMMTMTRLEKPSESWRSIDQAIMELLDGIRTEFTGFMDEFYLNLRKKFIQTQLNEAKETNDQISLIINIHDKRHGRNEVFQNACVLKADMGKSLISLKLSFAEHVRDERVRGLQVMDWMQVPFFNGFRMSHDIKNLASYGLKHGDKIEVHVLTRGDERLDKIFQEVITNGCLDTSYNAITCIGGNQVKPCHLFIEVPVQDGVEKLVFFFTKKTDGKALFEALVEFNDDWGQDAISLTWAGTSSKVEAFDNLYAYFGSSSTIKLTVRMTGGAKGQQVKKQTEKKKFAEKLKSDMLTPSETLENSKYLSSLQAFSSIQRMLNDVVKSAELDPIKTIENLVQNCPIDQLDGSLDALNASENSVQGRLKKCSQHIYGEDMLKVIAMKEEIDALIDSATMVLQYSYAQASVKDTGFNMGKLKQMISQTKAFKAGVKSAQNDAML